MMDERVPGGLFLNQQNMMTQAEQQQAAKVYVSAFLESTLHGNDAYKPLFENNKTAPDWLPSSSNYVSRYEDASFLAAARYEEDVNKLTLPSGGKLSAKASRYGRSRRRRTGTIGIRARAVLCWNGTLLRPIRWSLQGRIARPSFPRDLIRSAFLWKIWEWKIGMMMRQLRRKSSWSLCLHRGRGALAIIKL